MHIFYTPEIAGNKHELDEQESKHAIRVLRLKRGDRVVLVDGRGGWYDAEIREDHPKRCSLVVVSHSVLHESLPYYLHIAIAPTKNMDRFEWFLEKATEIGISEITILICQRSERRQVKMDRLDRILVSAMKQSLKAFKPVLNPPVPFTDFLHQDIQGMKAIAHCLPADRISLGELGSRNNLTILVGPEGDFSEEEVKQALESGCKPLLLGASRLRTETAGVHICSAISVLNSMSRQA